VPGVVHEAALASGTLTRDGTGGQLTFPEVIMSRQHTDSRETDFASSPHEESSPPRMKIRLGYFHVSIKSADDPQKPTSRRA
jgi:hypothetical protein